MVRYVGLTLLSLLILVTNLNAQQAPDICYGSKQNYSPASTISERPQVADAAVDERGLPKENRLSYWAFRHDSLHRRGIIKQILDGTHSQCCGGTDSGECRVSRINWLERKVLVDGEWCPLTADAKAVSVEGLENDEEVVVCAGQTARSFPGYNKTICPSTYCIGQRGGT